MENMRNKIAEIITQTHRTPLEQADEILLLLGVVGRSEQLKALLEKLLVNNMCSVVGDELIEEALKGF